MIETLQQSPGIHRVEAQLLVHEAGLVSRPFVHQGFRRYPRLFMALSLTGTRLKTAVHPGDRDSCLARQDYQSAAAVITAAYRRHVDAEINDQYRTLSGSLRFLNNIVRFPGCGQFDAESSFIAVNKGLRNVSG